MEIKKMLRFGMLAAFLPLLPLSAVFCTGCSLFSTSPAVEKTFPELISHFAKNGVVINGVGQLMYQLAQAEAGYCFRIGKREIGIYQYNLERKKQRHRYQLVQDSGVLYINGQKFKALINGSFVMIDFDSHPDSKKIAEAFLSF